MNITISERFYKEASKHSIRTFLGKALKRIDVIDDKEDLKNSIKELTYEHYRDFLIILESFSKGLETHNIEFKTKDQQK